MDRNDRFFFFFFLYYFLLLVYFIKWEIWMGQGHWLTLYSYECLYIQRKKNNNTAFQPSVYRYVQWTKNQPFQIFKWKKIINFIEGLKPKENELKISNYSLKTPIQISTENPLSVFCQYINSITHFKKNVIPKVIRFFLV